MVWSEGQLSKLVTQRRMTAALPCGLFDPSVGQEPHYVDKHVALLHCRFRRAPTDLSQEVKKQSMTRVAAGATLVRHIEQRAQARREPVLIRRLEVYFRAMRIIITLTVALLYVVPISSQTREQVENRLAQLPPEQRAYERFRYWVSKTTMRLFGSSESTLIVV
jgi:hypothetical protein